MGVLRLVGFAGTWPIRDNRALPDNAASEAVNIRVGGGAYLNSMYRPKIVKQLLSTTLSVHRIPLPGENTLDNSFWMEFSDVNTDVVNAPIVNDSFERIYWASPSTGLLFAPKADIISGEEGFKSGVIRPATAITSVTPQAGTGDLDDEGDNTAPKVTRSYMVTFVNEYGEESEPSDTTEVSGFADQHYSLTGIPRVISNNDYPVVPTIRIYRTVVGNTGTAFYRVADIPKAQSTYSDVLSDTVITGQGEAESLDFTVPPEGLQGLIAMPNGIFVSWKGSDLYFTENYRPHAWPLEYRVTVDYPIVGLGVFGNSCVVCTTGNPSIVSGVRSNAMALTKIDAVLPCLSRRSIISTADGVVYATEDGLVSITANGTTIITRELMNRNHWRDDFHPRFQRSMEVSSEYVSIHPGMGTRDGFMFRPSNAAAMGVIRFDLGTNMEPINVGVEQYSGKPWMIASVASDVPVNRVKLYEWGNPTGEALEYLWRTKEVQYPYPINFAVFQVYFDNGGGPLRVRVYITLRGNTGTKDRFCVYDENIPFSGQETKLPSGYKSDLWEIELQGKAEVQSFLMATSVRELRAAS